MGVTVRGKVPEDAVTDRNVEAEMVPRVAVMLVDPAIDPAVARPVEEIDATAVVEEVQVTELVMSRVLESE